MVPPSPTEYQTAPDGIKNRGLPTISFCDGLFYPERNLQICFFLIVLD